MKTWTKTAGLIFMAAASVYADRAIAAKPGKAANSSDKTPATDVKVLDETDPFAVAPPATEPAAAEAAKVSAAPLQINPDGTFSLNITAGANLVEQLRVIGYQAQTSIIPSKDVRGALPAIDLYNVTVHEALDALLHANGFAWREKGKFIYVYSAKEIAEMEKANRVTNTEVFRLYYTPAANAVNMLKPVLSGEAQVSFTTPATSGIDSGAKDVGGNSHALEDIVVVTDYPENLEKARQILKEVDRRPQQILIEATILRATLSDENSLGVDFNVIGGVDFSAITTNNFGQITGAGTGTITGGSNTVHAAGTGNAFTKDIAGGLKVGVVSNNVSVFLSALEGVADTTILANPKVLALNKQKGEVMVGRKDGYVTTTQTETSSTQTVDYIETGTRLIFRPYIGDDGYIRMEIHPEDSTGGLNADKLPYKRTAEVTSNVMVRDGHTIVIGGLFREYSDTVRSQVPGLGSIPLAGLLFRQQADTTTRDEVIILLTPHIVKDDAVYSQLSEQQIKDAEKLRVGVRKGMMLWGRERLAELNYEWAVEAVNQPKPDRDKALWHLDAATNLNPKFLEAIDLKRELTGKELSTCDNSSVRSFVRRAILADKAPAVQPTSEVEPAAPTPTTLPVAKNPSTQPAEQPTEAADAGKVTTTDAAAQPAIDASPVSAPAPRASWGWSTLFRGARRSATGDENATQTAVTELPTEAVPADGHSANK